MSTIACGKMWHDNSADLDVRQDSRSASEGLLPPVAGALTIQPAIPGLIPTPRASLSRLNQLIDLKRNNALPIRDPFSGTASAVRIGGEERLDPTRVAPTNAKRSGVKRLIAVILCTVVAVYAGSPVATAVQMAAALQRDGSAALTQHIEWESLRSALHEALTAEAQRNADQPMPAFIGSMAQDTAERLSSSAGLDAMLSNRQVARGSPPATAVLSRVRMVEAGRWEVTLNAPSAPDRTAKLTLALTDVARMQWAVQKIELPAPIVSRFR